MSLLHKIASFNIQLDQPNQYKAGDLISGNISLSSEVAQGCNLNVGSISITFSGRTTTSKHIVDVGSRRNSLQLFAYKSRLYTGPGQLFAPGRSGRGEITRRFPFRFVFPSNCGSARTEDLEGAPFFDADPIQPLPPSFTDDVPPDRGSVVYELSVELLAPGFKGYYMEGSFVQKQTLNVSTVRNVLEPTVQYTSHSKSFFHQSLDLLPTEQRELHSRPKTVGQILGLRSESTDRYPKAVFKATVLMPSVAILGQPLPLMLHVDHNLEESTVAESPIIHLKQAQVWLRGETSVCGMTHRSLRLQDSEQTSWTQVATLAQKSFDKAMPRVERLDLRKVMDLTLDPSLAPTFKTFNVARTYSVRVGARIRCAGKDFHLFGMDYVRCTILAKDFSSGSPDYTLPPPSIAEEEGMGDDPPPPYERVEGPWRLEQPVVRREPSLTPREEHETQSSNCTTRDVTSRGLSLTPRGEHEDVRSSRPRVNVALREPSLTPLGEQGRQLNNRSRSNVALRESSLTPLGEQGHRPGNRTRGGGNWLFAATASNDGISAAAAASAASSGGGGGGGGGGC